MTATFDATDPATYSYANTATVYDSLGNAHELSLYFTKTGTNTWKCMPPLTEMYRQTHRASISLPAACSMPMRQAISASP
ncbi:flagellar basal body FlgE domain-containing protein [Azotobacter chroococcum]